MRLIGKQRAILVSDADARTVPCPSCRKPAAYAPSNRWRPFCSERCRLADLGAWASERFRVPADPDTGAEPGPPERH